MMDRKELIPVSANSFPAADSFPVHSQAHDDPRPHHTLHSGGGRDHLRGLLLNATRISSSVALDQHAEAAERDRTWTANQQHTAHLTEHRTSNASTTPHRNYEKQCNMQTIMVATVREVCSIV
mmetsp:Transcript_9020/g.20356  ORF Transcript_9020/g.20356 Transcript_9020/m.20356 type:complete len:123 (+) Transcript_9020:1690-2058(+)